MMTQFDRERVMTDALKLLATYPDAYGYINEPLIDEVITGGLTPGETIATGSGTELHVRADGSVTPTRYEAGRGQVPAPLAAHVTQDVLRHKAIVIKAARYVLGVRGISVHSTTAR